MTPSRVVLVTGGAQGIGRATAQHFLSTGHRVVIADADTEAGTEAAAEINNDNLRFISADIAREADVIQLLDSTIAAFGQLDCLINNAAVMCTKPLAELSLGEWQRVIDVNLTGALLCSKYAAPQLAARRGAIVNIASTRAHMSEPDTEAYAASKGGLLALTHALALSLGPQVRVNCVSPGWIDVSAWHKRSARTAAALRDMDHAQHPAGRVGRPEDIAELIAYLCSEAAGFITGQEFIADGGMTRKMIYVE